MTTTTSYVIYREGSSNAYNFLGPVGVYDGTGATAREREEDAISKAREDGVSEYVNQYLSARPWARCSAEDKDAAWSDQQERECRLSPVRASVR